MPGPNKAADRKLIVCPICQKSFTTVYSKKAHMLVVHENAGRFKCGHCDKTFQVKSNLKRHEEIHTGEKPFKCKKCSKRFNNKTNLKRHELDNHAEKKFICEQCNKGFGREEGLEQHLVVHLEEKQFQCDKCPKRFPSKNYLRSHLFCHAGKNFKCDPCGKSFTRKDHLKTHLQKMHKEDREEVEEQPDKSNSSGARSKPTNRRADPDLDESLESKSNRESGGEEAVQPERDAEQRKIKTENCLPDDEQVSELDDSMESSLKRVKREPEDGEGSRSSGESDNEGSDESGESDEETDQEDEAVEHDPDDPMEGSSKRIKREPDSDDQTEDAEPDYYDFNELVGINQRIKRENEMITLSSDESD